MEDQQRISLQKEMQKRAKIKAEDKVAEEAGAYTRPLFSST
jgi:hypothetical protein